MISIKNTENLTGITISGDFNDLYNYLLIYKVCLGDIINLSGWKRQ